jgi:hypothetical protein
MTFLELCQRLRQEVGAAGSGPASVSAQHGEYARFVSWVPQAWLEIQLSRHSWRFTWAEASVPVEIGLRTYSPPADLGTWDKATLKCNDRTLLAQRWAEFRKHDVQDSDTYPRFITQRPDGVLVLDSSPDQDGQVTFEYWRTPQALIEGGDAPRLPDRYHMVIVYRAMLYYGLYENAPEVVQAARSGEAGILQEMVAMELPPMTPGGPLA